jgi:sulfur carrier protein
MGLSLTINGQGREFEGLGSTVTLTELVAAMELKGDRIAVEHNGGIATRASWSETQVVSGDRLEIVHFVGGGAQAVAGRLSWRTGTFQGAFRMRKGVGNMGRIHGIDRHYT